MHLVDEAQFCSGKVEDFGTWLVGHLHASGELGYNSQANVGCAPPWELRLRLFNMVSPPPDPKYIEVITQNPAFETSFLLMDAAGISVTLKKR